MAVFFLIIFFGVIGGHGTQERLKFTQNWETFVSDVWDDCFQYTNICKSVYSSFYVNNPTNEVDNTAKLQHFSEQVMFHRVRESMDSTFSSKYPLYQIFMDTRDGIIQQTSEQTNYLNSISSQLLDTKLSTYIWILALDNLQRKLEEQFLDQENIDKTAVLNAMKLETAKILANLHVTLFTKDLSLKALSFPYHIKTDPQKRIFDETSTKRNAEDANTKNTVSFTRCSPNKYPVWNPILNSYDCICYSDKNCLLDIMSVSEPDTIHPIILIVLVIIAVGLFIRIYQSTSAAF